MSQYTAHRGHGPSSSKSSTITSFRPSRPHSPDPHSPDRASGARSWNRHGSKSSNLTTSSPNRVYNRDMSREREMLAGKRAAPEPDSTLAKARPGQSAPGVKQSSQSAHDLQRTVLGPADRADTAPARATDFPRTSSMRNLNTDPSPSSASKTGGHEERRGFFKRMFSSSHSRSNLAVTDNASDSPQRQYSAGSMTASADASPAPTKDRELNKKASFFRRRKKSLTEANEVPQLPLQVQNQASEDTVRSSLYRAMDPYLAAGSLQTPLRSAHGPLGASVPRKAEDSSSDTTEAEPTLFHSGYTGSPEGATARAITPSSDQPTLSEPVHTPVRAKSAHSDATPTALPRTHATDRGESVSHASQSVSSEDERFTTPHETSTFPADVQRHRDGSELPSTKASTDELGTHDASAADHATALSLHTFNDPGRNMSVATATSVLTSMSALAEGPTDEDRERAKAIYEGLEEPIPRAVAATYLGERKAVNVNTLRAYMDMYDFKYQTILGGLRMLCKRLVLKAESQQVDRILDRFAQRWCDCNPEHGFKLKDVVHTICYSLLLLNTDLHMADIESKMTRAQFVKNALPTIKRVVAEASPNTLSSANLTPMTARPGMQWQDSYNSDISQNSASEDGASLSRRLSTSSQRRPTLTKRRSWTLGISKAEELQPGPAQVQIVPNSGSTALVGEIFDGKPAEWHYELEQVLKSFFSSIKNEALPLNEAKPTPRKPGSIKSVAPSEMSGKSRKTGLHSVGGRWGNGRMRQKIYASSTYSRTSFDDNSSVFTPAGSSAWSKLSLGKTMTTMSGDSSGQHFGQDQTFPQSIGFANALSQINAREDGIEDDNASINPQKFLLEDDTLELAGAPWAKEGMVKHKHHFEASDKKAKERNWSECFAVVERGYLRLFSFNSKGGKSGSLGVRKSMMQKGKAMGPSVVGGGNWMSNAEQLGCFLLRQTIASTLPHPGYSKARPHVWALSLPSGAVHLFQVGTPDIATEFMKSANYWSARLSKEPLMGGVENTEYGWSDSIILYSKLHPALLASAAPLSNRASSRYGHSANNSISVPRASISVSVKSGHEGVKSKLPGDKAHLEEWKPPAQSMMASQLMEVDQLQALKDYVRGVESDLAKHNELRTEIPSAYSPRHPNGTKAISNWEKKSAYLLREIIKFRTYIDALNSAREERTKIDAERADRETEKADRERAKADRAAAAEEALAALERAREDEDEEEGSGEEPTPRIGSYDDDAAAGVPLVVLDQLMA